MCPSILYSILHCSVFYPGIAAYLRHSVQPSSDATIDIVLPHTGITDINRLCMCNISTQHLFPRQSTSQSTWNCAASAGYGVVPASWSQPPEIVFNLIAPSHHWQIPEAPVSPAQRGYLVTASDSWANGADHIAFAPEQTLRLALSKRIAYRNRKKDTGRSDLQPCLGRNSNRQL